MSRRSIRKRRHRPDLLIVIDEIGDPWSGLVASPTCPRCKGPKLAGLAWCSSCTEADAMRIMDAGHQISIGGVEVATFDRVEYQR